MLKTCLLVVVVTTFIAIIAVNVVKQFSSMQTGDESNVFVSREIQPNRPTYEVSRLLPTPTKYPTFDIPTRTAITRAETQEVTEVPTFSTYSLFVKRNPTNFQQGNSREFPAFLRSTFRGNTWEIKVGEVFRGDAAFKMLYKNDSTVPSLPDNEEYVVVNFHVTNIKNAGRAVSFNDTASIGLTGKTNRLYVPRLDYVPTPLHADVLPHGWADGQYLYRIQREDRNLIFVINERDSNDTFYVTEYGFGGLNTHSIKYLTDNPEGKTADSPALKDTLMVQNPIAFRVVEYGTGDAAEKMVTEASILNPAPRIGMKYICIRIRLKYYGKGENDDNVSTRGVNSRD